MNDEKFDKMRQKDSTKFHRIFRKMNRKELTKICKWFSRKVAKFVLLEKAQCLTLSGKQTKIPCGPLI